MPSPPACFSQVRTLKDAIEKPEEVIAGYLESFTAHDEPIPPPGAEEVVKVAI